MIKKAFSILLAIALLVGIALPIITFAEGEERPIVIGIDTLSTNFNPFSTKSISEGTITAMTQTTLMTRDRSGDIVYDAIEGEIRPYNGVDYTYHGIADLTVKYDEASDITTYTAKLKPGILFSDGVEMTADDLIFTYYVCLDPSYTGPARLDRCSILGVDGYRQGLTVDDDYTKNADIGTAIFKAGKDHAWASGDAWTEEQQIFFWQALEAAWKNDVNKIVQTVLSLYSAYIESYVGVTPAAALENEGLGMIAGMVMWGYGNFNKATGIFTTNVSSTKFNTKNDEFPTLDDFYNEIVLAYNGDPVSYASSQSPDGTDILDEAFSSFIAEYRSKNESKSVNNPKITGIKKLDDYTVEVQTSGYDALAVYSIFGIEVAPMHYYGDASQYNYANNMFGFPFSDLSLIQSKTSMPMGAGPYRLIKYENHVVYFEANDLYYKGAPLTKYLEFKETNSANILNDITTGMIDAGQLNGTAHNYESIKALNGNGEITGSVITTRKVDSLSYGYIGFNAINVSVGNEPGSEASKNLRKAIATILAIYRATGYDRWFGEAASVIQYPVSITSWAAPKPTDPDFKDAFSVDVNGNPIYTADMTPDETYAAAIEAAKGFLIAAGFTYDEAIGMFIAAPEGAKLSYEVIVLGDGQGSNPNFPVLAATQTALASIGIELVINDPTDSNVLWNALNAGTAEMWCAASKANTINYMDNSYYNSYMIKDDVLDKLIVDANKSDDETYRKALYKTALDIIVDWAIQVPAYLRQDCVVISTKRLDVDSFTPANTMYWNWLSDIETLKAK